MLHELAFWLLVAGGGPQAVRSEGGYQDAPAQSAADAQALAEAGAKLASEGNLREAGILFEKALKLNPNDFVTRRNLAATQWKFGDLNAARQNLEYVLKAKPGDQQSLLLLRNVAAAQWELGDLNAARRNLECVLKGKPGDRPSILLLGMVSEDLKDYSRGAALLSAVPDLVREHSESVAALARCYYRVGKSEQARSELQMMKGSEAVFLAGEVALDSGDYETAERFWRSIESSYSDRAALGYRLGKTRFLSGRIEESQHTILGLLESGIRSVDLYNLLAWCYERQDRLQDAVTAMEKAIALEPARESNYLDLGSMLQAHQVWKVALEAARRAVAVAPRSIEGYRLKAFLETKLYAHFDVARRTFDEAIAKMPDSPEPLRALAVAQWDYGTLRDAAATFEDGLRRFPRNALLYQDYARMLLSPEGGGVDDAAKGRAVRLLETALRLDESLPESHCEMGKIALDESRPTEALHHLIRAAELDPNSSRIHYLLGRVYRLIGRPEEVAREMKLSGKLKQEEDNAAPGFRRQL